MANGTYDAVVIGAGHNGLVTAAYLAGEGMSVLVLERLDKIGGAVTTDEFAPGFMGPMCSYVVHALRGKVIDDLRLREHGFEFTDVGARGRVSSRLHPFPDGSYIGGPEVRDQFDTINQIQAFSEHDARNYPGWLDFWDQAAAILDPYYLKEPPTIAELAQGVRGSRQEDVLEKLLTWSYIDLVESFFEDEKVQAHAMTHNIECDPSTPGSMLGVALFKCSQFNRPEDQGIPRMSMGTVSQSIADSARSRGAEIRTRAIVEKVIVEDGEAKGVRLAGGEEIRAEVVVCNADPKRTFSTMFEPEQLSGETRKRLKRWKTKAGCVKFLAGLSELPDFSSYLGEGYDRNGITYVNIMPSVAYHQASWDAAMAGRPSQHPMMSIQLTSTAEPGLVRGNGHVMSIWTLYYPPVLAEGSWDQRRDEVGEYIIDVLTQYAPNFRESIVEHTVQAPLDIETRVGMTDGNIRHLDMIPNQLLSQRQPYRTEIRNFYMCGAGTHPMGEVTGAPGHNAAHAIMRDQERIPA